MTTLSTASFDELLAKGTSPTATKEDIFMLAECYENGGDHKNFKNAAPSKDMQKAIQYFLQSSDMGHVTATRYAAYWCRALAANAPASAKFAQNAFELYTKAASEPMNDPRAMCVLGYFYEKGLTTTGADIIKGGSAASSAAAGGVVVSPSNKTAAEWYQKAIASGNDNDGTATVNLALMYEKGLLSGTGAGPATLEDKQKAFELFKTVADKADCKNAAALINTGLYYEKGEKEGVVPKDMATALNKYYLRAANLGDSTAMAIVGCCFETGQGCAVNNEMAADFYVKGAMAGNNHAREGLRRLRDAGKI